MVSDNLFWQKALIKHDSTLGKVVEVINNAASKIALVIDSSSRFIGTISDGDIRRGLLEGMNLQSSASGIINRHAIVVSPGASREVVINLMLSNKVQQIPEVDKEGKITGLHLWDEITVLPKRQNTIIIMAGGEGKRLRPYTQNCPKPLLEVAGKPIIEHIIGRAKSEGFSHFLITLNYLGNMIEEYLGNGKRLEVSIDYVREDLPLGTAGSLGLLKSSPNLPFLVVNGDIVSEIQYGDLLDFHIHQNAIATMAVREHILQNPYGVVKTNGLEILSFEEKPIFRSYINAGVYALNPEVLIGLKRNHYCDMPELFRTLQEKNFKTIVYHMYESWIDVGRPLDLQAANIQNSGDI